MVVHGYNFVLATLSRRGKTRGFEKTAGDTEPSKHGEGRVRGRVCDSAKNVADPL